MSDMGLSLDDIIKKTKPSKPGVMRGRGGIRKGVSRGARANDTTRPRTVQPVTDARFKIIQKNREKLTDARDKLAEIAKQSDARLKLNKLRANHHVDKSEPPIGGISRKTGRNGRISLTTNKIPSLVPRIPSQNYMPPTTTAPRNISYNHSLPHMEVVDDLRMDYNEDPYSMEAPPLRRTVSNEYAPTPPPPPPVFSVKADSPYTWVKQPGGNFLRGPLPRKAELERTRDFKVVARSQMTKYEPPLYKEHWAFGSKSRTILTEGVEPKYLEPRSHREIGVKSRLDGMPGKPRTLGVLVRPKSSATSSSSSSSQSTGYRIVVSNLQANVTQEDIKELFEDVGELLVSRLVRPGTAEVIYKTLKDATKAVETYHNRQLDGHPMKCLLVNPRPKNNPTGTAVRSLTESRRTASSSCVQPSLGAVHRALFDDIVVKLRPN